MHTILVRKNRSVKQPPMSTKSPDDYQTPVNALLPLYPYLKKKWLIWECASGKNNLVNELKQRGYQVIGTDIIHNAQHNFLHWHPENFDCIITNPPYTIKQDFLERCYGLKKPFALLLPLTTFETPKRQGLFKKYGVQVIFFDKRINFDTPDGSGSGSWFATAWFTWGLDLPKDLTFVKLNPTSSVDKWIS